MHAGRPDALAAQEAALALRHQHDDRRIGAREVLRLAGGVAAGAHVAGLGTQRPGAAHAAEAMARVPVEDAARIGEDGAVALREKRAVAAQIGEFAAEASARRGGILEIGEVEGEMRCRPGEAEEHERPLAVRERAELRTRREKRRRRHLRRRGRAKEVLAAPHRHEPRARIGEEALEPGLVAAQRARAVEAAAGIEIGLTRHAAFLARRAPPRNRRLLSRGCRSRGCRSRGLPPMPPILI